VHQHVAAPDQVDRPGAGRDVLGCPGPECRAILARGGTGGLDVPGHRVDPGDAESEPLVQGQRVTALAASNIEGDRAWRQPHRGDEVEQLAGAARVQALIQRGRELLLGLRVGAVGLLR